MSIDAAFLFLKSLGVLLIFFWWCSFSFVLGGLLFLVATGYGWGRGWLESGLHGVSTLSYAGALVPMGFVFQF